MPQLPPAEGIFRVVLQYTWVGQEVRNVLNFQQTTPVLTQTPEFLAAAIEDWWRTNVKPLQSTLINLHHVMVQDLGAAAPPATLHAVAAPQAGSLAGSTVPNNVTLALTLRTAFAGRSFRGRIYHPGMLSSQITSSTVNAATVTSLIAAYNPLKDLATQLGTVHMALGVLSYYSNKAIRDVPVFTPVTLIDSDGIVDSQRRRLPGRGR